MSDKGTEGETGAGSGPQGQSTHNDVHDAGTAVMVGTHNGDNHFHSPREQPPKRWHGVPWVAGAALVVAVAAVVALIVVLTREQRELRGVDPVGREQSSTSVPQTSPSPTSSATPTPSSSAASTTTRPPVTEAPPPPTSRPAFKRVEEFTPVLAADQEPCTPSQLCAYRGVLKYSPQFDLHVSDSYADICLSVRANDPGFASLVKGSDHHIDLYPGRSCTGKPQTAPLVPQQSATFHFFSYVVRR